jgi:hypothetical protein
MGIYSCILRNNNVLCEREDDDSKMMKMCENYVLSYKPLYIVDNDTLIVARFNKVPDSINSFLLECAKSNDLRPLKYSLALIVRHNVEYLYMNKSDYIIGDGLLIENNGFIVLLRKAMGIGNINDSINTINYFQFYTGDVCLWMNKHKKSIVDFEFIKKFRKKISCSIR